MRIVSWNVHRCIGTDQQYNPRRIADVLSSLNADVIALQEIDSSLRAEDGRDQLTFIASCLGMDAVMGPTLDRDYGAYGNALLSKFPLQFYEEWDLSYRKSEPRGAIAAHFETEGLNIRVINTHLGLKYWERSYQISQLIKDTRRFSEECLILMGDFNEWFPYWGNNARLERAFKSARRVATFPATWPRFALDRIFLSAPVLDFSFEVVRTEATRVASDHLPVFADCTFKLEH